MVYKHVYCINSANTSTSTFFSQSKTDHYIFKKYAITTAVYFIFFHVKGGNIKWLIYRYIRYKWTTAIVNHTLHGLIVTILQCLYSKCTAIFLQNKNSNGGLPIYTVVL